MSMLEKNLSIIERYTGKIMVCRLVDGRTFSARLISVSSNGMLLFETSSGALLSDMYQDIVQINEYKPRLQPDQVI